MAQDTTNKIMDVREVLLHQYRKGRFNRLDTFVRYGCVVEGGKWWKVYKKMQYARNLMSAKGVGRRIAEFERLIKSMKRDGFRTDLKGIRLDDDLELVNGSHRLAVALALGIDKVAVTWPPRWKKVRRGYSEKWFRKNGFSKSRIAKIDVLRLRVYKELGIEDSVS